MKKRIWHKIKQISLGILLAGFVMTSGTQETLAQLPDSAQETSVEKSVKWGKRSGEFRMQSEQESGEEELFGDEAGNDIQDGNGQAEENLPGQETEEEDPSGDGFDNDAQSETEPEDQVPEALDGEENGEGTAPEEGENPEEKPEQDPDEETEENPNTEPGTGEDTEIPEEETADFVLTAEVNPETARAG